MRRFTLFIALLICFGFSFGQRKVLNGILYQNGDTSLWYKYQNIIINNLSLTRLDTSSSRFYFRIWEPNRVLDIWQKNDNSFFGQLTFWVNEQVPTEEESTKRILISKKIIEDDTVKKILELIENSQIIELPTDDSIKGWKRGLDGITYITEFSSKTNYSFKTYWTPKVQDPTLMEAKHIQSFVDKIFELSNSVAIWKQFEKTIPYECYTRGGSVICKVLTKKEKREFAKERKNYRRQMYLQKKVVQGSTSASQISDFFAAVGVHSFYPQASSNNP